MAKDQEAKKREAEAKRRVIELAKSRIRELVNKVPQSHSSWSYQRTLDFKRTVDTARSVLASERATVERAQMACSALEGFHK